MEHGYWQEYLNNPSFLPIITAIIVILIVSLLTIYFFRRGRKGNTILICGESGAGKTLLFLRLVYGQSFRETQTSIKENVGIASLQDRRSSYIQIPVIDLPGYDKLRRQCFDKYINNVRSILFLIDSFTIQKNFKDVAQQLFEILSHPVVNSIRPKILIVCNKQDIDLSKGSTAIRNILEKELTVLQNSKSSTLSDIGSPDITITSSSQPQKLTRNVNFFHFDDLVSDINIKFVELSLLSENPSKNIQQISDFCVSS